LINNFKERFQYSSGLSLEPNHNGSEKRRM
jgi:hypothetical protein